ncbi:ABC transporter substrate-binding protein [Candidatus Pacearchaeota archaeon]|nr:ABC transporter substrate-binding protein [Candidatus Pacearchaeota archaeon]
MNKAIWIVIGVILVLAIAGGIYYYSSSTKINLDETPVKISIGQWPGYAFAFVAQEKGFFEKNGVKVELIYDQDYFVSRERFKDERLDGIFEVYSDAIKDYSEGIKTKFVYITDYSESGDIIIGRKEFNSLSDLKGKKVGIDGINSFSNIFVLASLEKVGLKETDVRFVDVSADDVLSALENGKIDAGHTWEPTKSAALAKGYKQLGKAGDIPGIIVDGLFFNSMFVEENPEKVKAIVKSLVEAKEFQKTNREEALNIMAKAENFTNEELASGLSGIYQPSLAENIRAMSKSPEGELYSSGKFISEFYFNRGQINKLTNLDDIIDSQFITSITK